MKENNNLSHSGIYTAFNNDFIHKLKDNGVSVIFRATSLLPDVRGDTVYCDDDGKFSITLKRDGYDVFVSGSSMSIVFFIDKLGHLEDGVRLNIYPQREVRSKLFKDE